MTNQEIADRLEIQNQLYRYARGVDDEDWDLWKSVFTEDAHLDYSSAGAAVGSRDEVADYLAKAVTTIPIKQHYITNVEIDFDGDRATVRAMFFHTLKMPDFHEMSACGGYYDHDFVRTPEGWKSERLVEHNDWFINRFGALGNHLQEDA